MNSGERSPSASWHLLQNLGLFIRYWLCFFDEVEQDAGGEVCEFLGVAMGFSAEPGEIDPQAVMVTLDGEAVGLALKVTLAGKD